jgi:hypothetical protein
MKTTTLIGVALFAAFCGMAMGDQEATNDPVVRSSEYGNSYAKSVPDEPYGQKGKTRIFSVGRENDRLICEYDWYASQIFIGGYGPTVVRFGPWQRGMEPQEGHLAIGFYRHGKTLREYSTLELAKLGSGVSESVSHYTVLGRPIGFRWLKGNDYLFEVKCESGNILSFDLNSGAIHEMAGVISGSERTDGNSVQIPKATDADLAALKGRENLRSVSASSNAVTDAGVAHLAELKGLQILDLSRTYVTDTGLAHLKELIELRVLILSGPKITDEGVAHLRDMKNLETLYLAGTQMTDAGCAHLKEMKALRNLALTRTAVGDAGLAHLKGMEGLESLNLSGTKVTDAGLAHLKQMKSLRTLTLESTKVTEAGIAELKAALPECKVVK